MLWYNQADRTLLHSPLNVTFILYNWWGLFFGFDDINKGGAYLTFKSIFHKALIVKSRLNTFLEPATTKQ